MDKNPSKADVNVKKGETVPMSPNQRINGNLTAQPKDIPQVDEGAADTEMGGAIPEPGEMNLKDARESGYTDENGNAVSMAKKDVKGSPTGAYTDIGAGRSSAVHHRDEKESSDKDKLH